MFGSNSSLTSRYILVQSVFWLNTNSSMLGAFKSYTMHIKMFLEICKDVVSGVKIPNASISLIL